MQLLGAILYDPASAAAKTTANLQKLTVFDATNLRMAFTIPAHGFVRVRMHCVLEGATTFPSILLGILNGVTVVARVSPTQTLGNTAVATARLALDCDFVVGGLTPGAVNWDAAYGVEINIASTNIKYGGPDDGTTDNAWGAFVFEVWDPKSEPTNFTSFSIDANGRVDISKLLGTAWLTPTVAGTPDVNTKTLSANVITAAAINDAAFDSATFANDTGLQSVRSATAQAGAAGTLTLDVSASAVDNFYNDLLISIVSGTGVGQARHITAYVGSTKVASVSPNWATTPDNTSVFALRPAGRVDLAHWVGSAPNALISGRVDSDMEAIGSGVVDTILDDAPSAELASIPNTTSSLRLMIQFLFEYFRNKRTITATTETLFKEDASTSLGTATLSDNGITKTKGEMG